MFDRNRRPSLLLTLSLALNAAAFVWIAGSFRERSNREHQTEALEQTVHTLYRILPKDFYTRNDFAFAVALPGAVPEVHDCLVQFGDDVFVFDTTNTIIGMYQVGPNPFVPSWPTWSEMANFKCDRRLLDDQTRRRSAGAADWNARMDGARQHVTELLKNSDSAWGTRRVR